MIDYQSQNIFIYQKQLKCCFLMSLKINNLIEYKNKAYIL